MHLWRWESSSDLRKLVVLLWHASATAAPFNFFCLICDLHQLGQACSKRKWTHISQMGKLMLKRQTLAWWIARWQILVSASVPWVEQTWIQMARSSWPTQKSEEFELILFWKAVWVDITAEHEWTTMAFNSCAWTGTTFLSWSSNHGFSFPQNNWDCQIWDFNIVCPHFCSQTDHAQSQLGWKIPAKNQQNFQQMHCQRCHHCDECPVHHGQSNVNWILQTGTKCQVQEWERKWEIRSMHAVTEHSVELMGNNKNCFWFFVTALSQNNRVPGALGGVLVLGCSVRMFCFCQCLPKSRQKPVADPILHGNTFWLQHRWC